MRRWSISSIWMTAVPSSSPSSALLMTVPTPRVGVGPRGMAGGGGGH